MDVGVDCNNWEPVALEKIIAIMGGKLGIDHHA